MAVSVHDGDPNDDTKKAKMSMNMFQGKINYKSLKEFLIPWIARSRTFLEEQQCIIFARNVRTHANVNHNRYVGSTVLTCYEYQDTSSKASSV